MSTDRPDLNKKRTTPRPAAEAGRDPVDTPAPDRAGEYSPEAKVLRQFRFSPQENELMLQLQRRRGERNLIDTQRWLISLIPGLLSGEYGIDPTQATKRR